MKSIYVRAVISASAITTLLTVVGAGRKFI
jgi:hypothetical protein